MARNDSELVDAVLEEIKFVHRIVSKIDEKRFSKDKVLQHAVIMGLINIGELSNSLSNSFKEKHAAIPWFKIIGQRNIMVHEYGKIDLERVWNTAIIDMPDMKKQLKKIGKRA